MTLVYEIPRYRQWNRGGRFIQSISALFYNKSTGHGLGMMIANRIMQEHGGQIGIESREGDGTLIPYNFHCSIVVRAFCWGVSPK